APRTWGWTEGAPDGALIQPPSPTHVGMDRRLMTTHTLDIAEPHARGDGPLLGDHACLFPKPSPTHVGMDRRPRATLETALAEPHARGDGPADPEQLGWLGNRAPRTWGWTGRFSDRGPGPTPSPTHVGMDRSALD